MKKFYRFGLIIISLLIIAAMLCGCGQSAASKYGADKAVREAGDAAQFSKAESASDGAGQVAQNRKIIEYIDLSLETKDFDKLLSDVNSAVKEAGGYIENSRIGGNSYYGSDRRNAELTVRIPKTKQSEFSDFISEKSNVVSRSVNTEDVTDKYIDTESRIKALTIEKETLEKLLAGTTTVADTLTVYEKLTNVIAEIESYQGRLDQMDNLIEYTTFTLYIDEVEKETNVKKQNWFQKTWSALVENLSDIGDGFLAFFSFVIAGLPYWIIIAVAVFVIVFLIRRHNKKKRAGRMSMRQPVQQPTEQPAQPTEQPEQK